MLYFILEIFFNIIVIIQYTLLKKEMNKKVVLVNIFL